MLKHAIFIFIAFSSLHAQDTKVVELNYPNQVYIHERFEVDPANPDLRTGSYKSYWAGMKRKDGPLQSEGQYLAGLKTGEWNFYTEEGELSGSGSYCEGMLCGEWSYYANGKLKRNCSYSENLPDGNWQGFNENERLSFQGAYVNGKRSGPWTRYYANGELMLSIEYLNGKKEGQAKAFYKNGKTRSECTYKNNKAFMTLSYYETGDLMYRRESSANVDWELPSNINACDSLGYTLEEVYDPGNKLKQRFHFACDSLVLKTEFFNKREKPFASEYENGSGLVKQYFADETVQSEYHFENYIPDGPAKIYFEGGKTYAEGALFGKNKVGEWTYYDKEGQIDTTLTHLLGEKHKGYSSTYRWQNIALEGSQLAIMPEYPGGEQSMLYDIYSKVKYPELARENNIEGKVVLKFVIDELGFVSQEEVVRSIHESLDQESMRVLKLLDVWAPGYQNGVPMKVYYHLPIMFRLE